MPDVTITNPPVQIDLAEGSSTTVPAGEQWRVTVITEGTDGRVSFNGLVLLDADGGSKRSAIEIDLFGGDTIGAGFRRTRIRGYRVD